MAETVAKEFGLEATRWKNVKSCKMNEAAMWS